MFKILRNVDLKFAKIYRKSNFSYFATKMHYFAKMHYALLK